MKKVLVVAAALLVALAVAPAQAQEPTKFKLYVAAAYVSPLSSEDLNIDGVVDSVEATDEVGYGIGFEWLMTKRLGLEFDYLYVNHDVEFGGVKVAEVDEQPISGSLNFHIIQTKLLDFYAGATVSYVNWGDFEATDGTTSGSDSETAYGAQVGLDIGLGEKLAIVTALRYLQMDVTESDTDISASVDPLFAKVGLAYRF